MHSVRVVHSAWLVLALTLSARSGALVAQVQCPISYGATDNAKPNKLYLYFPTADDATFPTSIPGASPARAFNIANLSSYTGTVDQLRDAIRDVVIDDYCEFNVKVIATTTAPPTTFPRRNIVAVGTDVNGTLAGQAQSVDAGDATLSDVARIWAGVYQSLAGGVGGELNGANSTLQRWAFSIGGSTAHEAGHNYGLSHANGALVATGEDALTRHLMPAGGSISLEQRASFRRHVNNIDFSTLAANVGLSIQTMHNWDLTNPNNVAASQLRMTFLHPNASVIMSWSYSGSLSPWVNPTVSGSLGTQLFKGTTYNKFQITWSTGQNWANGTSGNVPAGVNFHIGATFSGVDFDAPDPVIITKLELLDGGGTALPLFPRLPGYDAGTLDAIDGSFDVAFFNTDGGDALTVTNVIVQELPRVLAMNNMVAGAPLETWFGHSIEPWEGGTRRIQVGSDRENNRLQLKDWQPLQVASMAETRHVYQNIDGHGCTPPSDAITGPEVNECVNGITVDLFPSTTLYLTADVIDPAARHWDPAQSRFVVGPVVSKIYYQLAGRHPDLNGNHIDDYVDIKTGTSRDVNKDGVPDEAVPSRGGKWWLWILIALLILALALWLRSRKATP